MAGPHDLGGLCGAGRVILAVGAHGRLEVHQPVERNIVAPGDRIIVEVVRAGDLHRARAERRIGIFVGNDRNQAPVLLRPDGNLAQLADDRGIALVRGMDGDRAVAQHRLGPRRGDRDIVARLAQRDIAVGILLDIFIGLAAGQRIFEVPHMAVDVAVLDLEVGNRRLELGIPVDQPLAAVDEAFAIERDEDLDDRLRQALVHGETLARPVAGGTKALELVDDRAAGLRLPLPDLVDEVLAAHRPALDLAFGELALDHHLRGDAGMVHARLPEDVLAAHALEADEDVLKRVVQRVAHVKRAGHVGRRDDDGEGVRAGLGARPRREGIGVLPGLGDPGFDGIGVVGLLKHQGCPQISGNRAGVNRKGPGESTAAGCSGSANEKRRPGGGA